MPGPALPHPRQRLRPRPRHATPWAHGGTSSSANMGALSRGHHTLKTEGWTDITESNADGSAIYVTVLGQRIPIPPRPVLGEPLDPTDTEAAEDADAPSDTDTAPPF